MSASSPATSPSSGISRCMARARRIASLREIAPLQVGARARRVALVEDEVQHVQHRARGARSRSWSSGSSKRHARRLDALLGAADPLRHRRLGHEKGASRSPRSSARRRHATSARSPTTAVSAGWQHMNSRISVSSRSGSASGGGAACSSAVRSRATCASRRRRALSLRTWSVMRLDGDLDQPAARVVRQPFVRPLHRRRDQRLLNGVLRGEKSPYRRITEPSTCGARSRSKRSA